MAVVRNAVGLLQAMKQQSGARSLSSLLSPAHANATPTHAVTQHTGQSLSTMYFIEDTGLCAA